MAERESLRECVRRAPFGARISVLPAVILGVCLPTIWLGLTYQAGLFAGAAAAAFTEWVRRG